VSRAIVRGVTRTPVSLPILYLLLAIALIVLAKGKVGECYLVGSHNEQKNIDVVHTICDLLDELHPQGKPHRSLIEFVTDRPGHDFRYSIDPTKIETQLGWKATIGFADGIRRTIEWYLARREWTDAIRSGAYRAGV
jgi:dTDP-glucose 4,6-dehydratase